MLITSVAVSLLAVSSGAHATILLQDNFNDNSIDGAKWNVVTTGIPQGSAAVVETGGEIQLINRGHLTTASEFQPGSPSIGTLLISGEWTFGSSIDYFEVFTRSDGTPNAAQGYGETGFGIGFFVGNQFDTAYILRRANGGHVETMAVTPDGAADFSSGTFDFVITDDGDNLTFLLTEQANPSNSVFLSGNYSTPYPVNLVTFHNREKLAGTNISYLDNVNISATPAVPEPSTYALAAIGLFGIGIVGWRQQNRAKTTRPYQY